MELLGGPGLKTGSYIPSPETVVFVFCFLELIRIDYCALSGY